jgi:hypothetical protein
MNFEFQGKPAPPQRSTFGNVLAWIFIVLGGFATFISILQNIMIRMLFHKEKMTACLAPTRVITCLITGSRVQMIASGPDDDCDCVGLTPHDCLANLTEIPHPRL